MKKNLNYLWLGAMLFFSVSCESGHRHGPIDKSAEVAISFSPAESSQGMSLSNPGASLSVSSYSLEAYCSGQSGNYAYDPDNTIGGGVKNTPFYIDTSSVYYCYTTLLAVVLNDGEHKVVFNRTDSNSADNIDNYIKFTSVNGDDSLYIKLKPSPARGTLFSQITKNLSPEFANTPSPLGLDYQFSLIAKAAGKNKTASGGLPNASVMTFSFEGAPLPSINTTLVGVDVANDGLRAIGLFSAALPAGATSVCASGSDLKIQIAPALTAGNPDPNMAPNLSYTSISDDILVSDSSATYTPSSIFSACNGKTINMIVYVGCSVENVGVSYFAISSSVTIPTSSGGMFSPEPSATPSPYVCN